VSKLQQLIDELDLVRVEIKMFEKQKAKAECERNLADLKNQETKLRRAIEREAHLYI
jgi:hypothetical protein